MAARPPQGEAGRVARALKPSFDAPTATTTAHHRRLSIAGSEPEHDASTPAAASAAASEPSRVARSLSSSSSPSPTAVHSSNDGDVHHSSDDGRRLRDARASVLALRRSLAQDGSGGGWGALASAPLSAEELDELDDDGRRYAEQLLEEHGGGLDVGAIALRLLPQAPLESREAQAEALLQREHQDAEAALERHRAALDAAASAARAELESERSLLDVEARRLHRELELRQQGLQAELRRMFAAAERRLRAAISWQRARVWQRFGALEPASPRPCDPLLRDESAVPLRGGAQKELRVRWDGLPQPVQVRLLALRGVRDRLPSGAYTVHAALFDRLGGRPLRWSRLSASGTGGGGGGDDNDDADARAGVLASCGATSLPVRHSASFSAVELPFHQPMRVLLPPRSHLHPGMVIVLRLYRTATRSAPLDVVCGWAALPACDADSGVAAGRFRLPLLRGDLDSSVASFATFEERAADRSAWLCNAYVAVTRMSREATVEVSTGSSWAAPQQTSTLREFDVKLALSSATLRLRRPFCGSAAQPLAALTGVHISGGIVADDAASGTGGRWRPADGIPDSGSEGSDSDADAPPGDGACSEPALLPTPAALLSADAWSHRAADARRLLAAEAQLMAHGQGLSMSLDTLLAPRPVGRGQHEGGAAFLDAPFLDADLVRALAGDRTLSLPPGGLRYQPVPSPQGGASLLTLSARRSFSYSLLGAARGSHPSSAAVARPRAPTALRRKCRLLRLELFDGCFVPPERAGAGARAVAVLSSAQCWAQLLTLATAFYARAFARVSGQYLLLRSLRVPVYQFALTPQGAALRYVAEAVPAHIELGIVAAAPLSALLLWLALAAGLWGVQRVFGPAALTGAAAPLCWFVLHLGVLTALDGPLAALADALAGSYDCADRFPVCATDPAGADCTCFDGDAWRLARRFALDEGSPGVGVAVAAALYALVCALSLAALWQYLSHVHLGGRIQDTYRRLVAPPAVRRTLAAAAARPEDEWLPLDDEVTLAELQRALLRADATDAEGLCVRLVHRREDVVAGRALEAPVSLTLRGVGGCGLVVATHVLQLAVATACSAGVECSHRSRAGVAECQRQVACVARHFLVDHRTGAVTECGADS